jgi:hypothetical protein
MLRDLISASGAAVSYDDILRVYHVCRQCYRRRRACVCATWRRRGACQRSGSARGCTLSSASATRFTLTPTPHMHCSFQILQYSLLFSPTAQRPMIARALKLSQKDGSLLESFETSAWNCHTPSETNNASLSLPPPPDAWPILNGKPSAP